MVANSGGNGQSQVTPKSELLRKFRNTNFTFGSEKNSKEWQDFYLIIDECRNLNEYKSTAQDTFVEHKGKQSKNVINAFS